MKSLFGIFSVLSLALLFAFTAPDGNGLEVGDTAPDFKLQNAIDDSWVSLSDYEGAKGYIVVFTCNACPYSKMYEDRINDLNKEYADKGYPVIAINPNDPDIVADDGYDEMKVRADKKSFSFKYLFDANQEVYPAYGATITPHVFLLDKDRVVKYIGAIDNNAKDADAATVHYVADAIHAMEGGNDPDPNFTKAIGCTIKVKS
jgi:peroxiredoxin